MMSHFQRFLHSSRNNILFLVTIIGFFLYTGCDPTINPIKENGRYYSIYGYLNATADTQFVRIEKLRDGQFTNAPANIDAKVILTNTTTGESATMHDSLFHFPKGDTHNYYTTLKIRPQQTYKIEVRNGNKVSQAQTAIPDTFPEPIIKSTSKYLATLEITGIDRLVGVKILYWSYAPCLGPSCSGDPRHRKTTFQYLRDTVQTAHSGIHVTINEKGDMKEMYPLRDDAILVKTKAIIVAGNLDWPNFLAINKDAESIPSVISNVEGGVGLLGGIASDTVLVYKRDEQSRPKIF